MLLTISSRSTNGPAPSTLIPPQHCTPSHAASQSAYKWHGSIGSHKRSIWDGVSWCLISAAILGELDMRHQETPSQMESPGASYPLPYSANWILSSTGLTSPATSRMSMSSPRGSVEKTPFANASISTRVPGSSEGSPAIMSTTSSSESSSARVRSPLTLPFGSLYLRRWNVLQTL